MLGFFRKYQRLFFIVITVVIVLSFSLFGTYNNLTSNRGADREAFTAVNGRHVLQSELVQMIALLGQEIQPHRDVFSHDFFKQGLAEQLYTAYSQELATDFESRSAREKSYVPYVHPQASFINAQSVWGYFAPDRLATFQAFQQVEDPLSLEAFQKRVQLYLSERDFSGHLLKQVLHYQQSQYDWIPPDAALAQRDLSLFGYHSIEDWFGPTFVKLMAQFVINSSVIAAQQGLVVTDQEVLMDLSSGGEAHVKELAEAFRRMGLDNTALTKQWKQVLLFRKLYDAVGASVLVDEFSYQKLQTFANETVTLDFYQLQPELRFKDFASLQKYEIYLDAVSPARKKLSGEEKLLTLQPIASLKEIEKKHPQLLEKTYTLKVAQVRQEELFAQVSLREVWDWELEAAHWDSLQTKFPEFIGKSGLEREERFAFLETLNPTVRQRVDLYAQEQVVSSHPEWVDEALLQVESTEQAVAVRLLGGKAFFQGLREGAPLMALLDSASLPGEESSENSQKAQAELEHFTADGGKTYYRIQVLQKEGELKLLTFAQLVRDGTLDKMLAVELENFYREIRGKQPALYRISGGEWKDLSEVREQVAIQRFEPLLQAIELFCKRHPLRGVTLPTQLDPQFCASYRFYPAALALREQLVKEQPFLEPEWTHDALQLYRNDSNLMTRYVIEQLSLGEWAEVALSQEGGVCFYQWVAEGLAEGDVQAQLLAGQELLIQEAKQQLTQALIQRIQSIA